MKKSQMELKIFVSCHKPSDFVENSIFQPVQVGAALHKDKLPGTQPDDSGDNISELNPKFCELTAQYWAWKNADADYYGFFHYRRYLAFRQDGSLKTNVWGCVDSKHINDEAIKKYGLDEDSIRELVKDYDIILPERRDIRKMPKMGNNLREQYLGSGYLHEEDLDTMVEVLKEKYPDFFPYAERYLDGQMTYFNNMFIMKKELFNKYCEWLFDILLECEKRIDYTNYSTEAIRTPGHLAERLLNIYILYLEDHGDYKIKELPTVVFLQTDPLPELKPAFKKNNVPVILSANDFYVPYIATALNSIIMNSKENSNYDIVIMNKDISAVNQARLKRLLEARKNFSLRFVNASKFEDDFRKLFLRGHFTMETWFRLLIPDLFKDYQKVLYIDADLVVNADLAELYQTNIDGYLLAACHDADTAGLYDGFDPKKKPYMDEVLKLKNPYDYFQAGVLLLNLDEFRKTYTVKEMLKLAASRKWQLLDQDVLNVLADGKVKFVDMAWNVMFDWRYIRQSQIVSMAPKYLSDAYAKAHANPKIVHYAGPDKPWLDPMADYAELFWKYAKGSLYYEEILHRMMDNVAFYSRRKKLGPKGFVRKYMIDVAFPVDTKRREKAIRFYLKARRRGN